jgi:hypothetical protein
MTHSSTTLSVGLLVRSIKIWRWQSELIQELVDSRLVKIKELVILDYPQATLPGAVDRLHKLDSLIFRSPMDAFESVDLNISSDVKVTNGLGESNKSACCEIDIWVNLSEISVEKEFFPTANLGLLETHFSEKGAPGSLLSSKAGYAEFSSGKKQLYFSIVARRSDGASFIVAESRPSLDSGPLSRGMNQYWKLLQVSWLRVFKSLQSNSLEELPYYKTLHLDDPESKELGVKSNKAYRNLASIFFDKFSQKFLRKEQWVLLLKFLDQRNDSHELPLTFAEYLEISPPVDCFWADPFVITEKNRHYVFFEELPFATQQGHLSCMEVFRDGSHTEPRIILKKPYHLSYPNVFTFKSDYYMVPESGDTGVISLYRSTDFPYEWQHEHSLMEGLHAYDSTLIEHDGIWWLFACLAAEKGMSGNEELHVFYAESPLSQSWEAHPQNPVICDASRARPAGQFFHWEGVLFRPSQDCAGSYGAGVNINKIIELTKQSYVEELVQCSRPNWDPKLTALHTLNFNQHVSVADAMRVDSRFLSK